MQDDYFWSSDNSSLYHSTQTAKKLFAIQNSLLPIAICEYYSPKVQDLCVNFAAPKFGLNKLQSTIQLTVEIKRGNPFL